MFFKGATADFFLKTPPGSSPALKFHLESLLPPIFITGGLGHGSFGVLPATHLACRTEFCLRTIDTKSVHPTHNAGGARGMEALESSQPHIFHATLIFWRFHVLGSFTLRVMQVARGIGAQESLQPPILHRTLIVFWHHCIQYCVHKTCNAGGQGHWSPGVLAATHPVARGMEALESLQPPILHRDLKPSNVFIDGAGHARVADLGLAR
eukprot:1161915-Pelagomonas_calceolata.AAC.8